VEIKLRDACSLWAPELSELPADEGGGVMLSFSATVGYNLTLTLTLTTQPSP